MAIIIGLGVVFIGLPMIALLYGASIKLHREQTRLGLKEAKDAVEAYLAGAVERGNAEPAAAADRGRSQALWSAAPPPRPRLLSGMFGGIRGAIPGGCMRSTRLACGVVVVAACVAAWFLSPRSVAADPLTHDQILKDWIYPDSTAGFDKQGPALVYHYRAVRGHREGGRLLRRVAPQDVQAVGREAGGQAGVQGSSDGGTYVFYLEEAAPGAGSRELPAASLSVRVRGSREGWSIFMRRIDAEKTRVTLIYDPPQGK